MLFQAHTCPSTGKMHKGSPTANFFGTSINHYGNLTSLQTWALGEDNGASALDQTLRHISPCRAS